MWHSSSKYWRIKALVKVNHKRLKAVLVLRVKNFGLAFIILKLVEFPLFDDSFSDLAEFRNFLTYSILFPLIPNLSTSSLSSFFLEASLLLSFLLEDDLLLLFLLRVDLSGDPIVFNIKVNGAAILLKSWINYL